MNHCLIIFAKNQVLGGVKTRIARRLGDELALKINALLLERTLEFTKLLPQSVKPVLYLSEYIDLDLVSRFKNVRMSIQKGNDLGKRMSNAFKSEWKNYKGGICIIGSDIFDLNNLIVKEAFTQLMVNDIVIGPAKDGGYYLIGMKKPIADLFAGIKWGSSKVFDQTLQKVKSKGLSFHLLKELNDVDEVDDIPEEIRNHLNF